MEKNMSNEEVLKLVYMISDMGNCVLPVCQKVDEESPANTAWDVIVYLNGILSEEIGDEVLADKLLDFACFMNKQELLKEIEYLKSL